MRKVMPSCPLVLVVIMLLLPPFAVLSAPSDPVLERASQSLVKIETATSAASGFIWRESSLAVTSLHVVDGHEQISATYVNADGKIVGTSPAVVEKVFQDADLVLLRLKTPLNRSPLVENPVMPKVKQSLDALGFPLNIAGYSNTEVKIRFGGNQLRSILPPKVLRKITNYPDTSLEILNLEGNLVPGLSGAPIIDDDGKVVGIVDGGLENGAIGICWGIPASHLNLLAQSSSRQLPGAAGLSELFSADLQAEVEQARTIGNVRLTKLRSRSFQQLAETADDQLGLVQLATGFMAYNFNPYLFQYDIYQDMDSGATVVVPEGAELSDEAGFTMAGVGDPRMEMKFRIEPAKGMYDAQSKAVQFEQEMTEIKNNIQVVPDPSWSYLQPIQRFGVVINRKALFRNIVDGFQWRPDKYYFETLASNGMSLLAVAAVNNDNSPQMLQMESVCSQNMFFGPECRDVLESRRVWAQMVLGVQLASFPLVQM